MRAICIIPARGGSVRIPRKNIKPLHGKPIIQYSIEAAKHSRLFDEIVVSTDDGEIGMVVRRLGARWQSRRPDDGTRGTQEVAAELLNGRNFRDVPFACVLYPTAPLLTWRDIYCGWKWVFNTTRTYVYTANEQGEDIGGFYWGPAAAFGEIPLEGNSFLLRIPNERAIDINTPEDWTRAEEMYAAIHR